MNVPLDTLPVPPLVNGDHLTREEFERRYEAMPDLKKAELIEGIVYMPSPVSHQHHGEQHFQMCTWLGTYQACTPGLSGSDNATVRLDQDNEPQPDVLLFIRPEHGGQVKLKEGYLEGAPELVVEVAASSVSIDRNTKLQVYRRNGVKEYLLWRVHDRAIDWFVLRQGSFQPMTPASDGLLHSEVFPGLWLDASALLRQDIARVLAVLHQGLASAEHAAFVAELQAREDAMNVPLDMLPVPPLMNGDHLTREEFERRYEAMPDLKKAELLEGIVYMPSPVSHQHHGRPHGHLCGMLSVYEASTPGVEMSDNATVRLDQDNELQPDVLLFIRPEHGGQVKLKEGYLEGAPELVVEVAASSVSIDRNTKMQVYRRNGVKEYLLWRVHDRAIDWFVLRQGSFQPMTPASDGLLHSEVFPGLWLDAAALLRQDIARVLAVLHQGLASGEHVAFVAELQARSAGSP